jgi:hypothetical protein
MAKFCCCYCEAEVSKGSNLHRKIGTVSIFTRLDEGLQFI